MPDKCIVFGCNNRANKKKDVPSSIFVTGLMTWRSAKEERK